MAHLESKRRHAPGINITGGSHFVVSNVQAADNAQINTTVDGPANHPAGQDLHNLHGLGDPATLGSLDCAFRASHSAFDGDLKWRLPSGSTVEDILHDAFFNKSLESSVRTTICNWVIDLGNDKMKALFSETDWEVIKAQVPPLPAINKQLARSLLRFARVKDTTGLRKVLRNTSFLPKDVPYDRAQHFDLEWAERVILQFLILFEHDGVPMRDDHLESWYTSNIWSDVIDKLFLSLPRVFLHRAEAVCQSSVSRKNRDRTETSSRLRSAPRLDGLVRSFDDSSHEFCAIEAAPQLRGGMLATKWLHDKAKLAKVLRDMLSQLVADAKYDRHITRQLQTVGIMTAGTSMQASRLCYGNGYVSLLVTEPLGNVPRVVGRLTDLLRLLVAFVQIKDVLASSIMAFQSRSHEFLSDEDEEGVFEVVFGTGPAVTSRDRVPPLPRPADSP